MSGDQPPQTRSGELEVLVSADCAACVEALEVVAQLRISHPQVAVRLTDVDEPGWQAPLGFVGTPMYLVEGRILSLGNPSPGDLRAALALGGP